MRDQIQLECLVRDLEDTFKDAWSSFSDYESAAMYSSYEARYYEESFRDLTKAIYVRLLFAFEALGLLHMLADFKSSFEPHRENLSAINMTALGYQYPAALDFLSTYFQPLKASVPKRAEADQAAAIFQLERILLGTPKLIKDRKLEPETEKDVREAMYQLLLHPYPDTVRELLIAKVSKTYKPDIGIPSLKVAVEYKFVDSEKELKAALGGIYEDVAGYAGSEDWKTFYAVMYMTEAFLTQAQVEAEFKLAKVDRSWKPLLVIGRGARRPKAA